MDVDTLHKCTATRMDPEIKALVRLKNAMKEELEALKLEAYTSEKEGEFKYFANELRGTKVVKQAAHRLRLRCQVGHVKAELAALLQIRLSISCNARNNRVTSAFPFIPRPCLLAGALIVSNEECVTVN